MIARLEHVSKVYPAGLERIVALEPTNFEIHEGQLVLIIGPSGSGKTTLLSLLGCVIYPSSGRLWVDGHEVNTLEEKELARLRLNTIGFVFQNFNLLAPLTARENVMMPLQLQKMAKHKANEKVHKALELVGMSFRKKSLPRQLSNGEQQRIAIARAVVTNPKIILCDEPTAALDSNSLVTVMTELRGLANKGKAIVVVTHDPRLKSYAHRIIEVNNGSVKEIDDFIPN
jgi:putative ABC transport system ATP-binding protein